MGKRQDTRDRIETQIIEIGRRHLVTEGAAGLSLRAVARDLGMVSSAVYRYVASRDDLLTLLLVDAYGELADTVDAAAAAEGGNPAAADAAWADRVVAMAHAARAWAVDQPARWALLYGSPVPGYRAPAGITVGPGTRVITALLVAVADGIAAGDIPDPKDPLPHPVSRDFAVVRAEYGFPGGDRALLKCGPPWWGRSAWRSSVSTGPTP